MTERLYYTDAALTSFDATITDIQEISRANGQSLWRLALDRSAFYPTSGGQPYDTGTLTATARSGAELVADILAVEEDAQDGRVWHHTAKPLLAGTPVHGIVNAARRLDHMQQHSGQHLLSAAFIQICDARTVSFHLGEFVSTIDLAMGSWSETTLQQVAELANRIIAEDRPVSTNLVSRQQAEEWLAAGELRKLPPRSGDLRIIEIRDFDRNACGGTHVQSTGQIGGLHLRGTEKVKQGVRVEFVCGLRAMRAAREDFNALTDAARQLSVSLTETPEAIRRLQGEGRQAARQIELLTGELMRYRAEELVRQTPPENGVRSIRLALQPPAAPNVNYAKMLASKLVKAGERTVAILSWREATPGTAAASPNATATIIFARSGDLTFDCGTLLRETVARYGGRGGGSKDMAQGSTPVAQMDTVLDALHQACSSVE